jgi:hypothetical protein
MISFINLKLTLLLHFLLWSNLIRFVRTIRKRWNNEMVGGDRGNSLLRAALIFNLGKEIEIVC